MWRTRLLVIFREGKGIEPQNQPLLDDEYLFSKSGKKFAVTKLQKFISCLFPGAGSIFAVPGSAKPPLPGVIL